MRQLRQVDEVLKAAIERATFRVSSRRRRRATERSMRARSAAALCPTAPR